MYRRPTGQMVIVDFVLPFEGKLNANNRWVKLAKLIPWERIETDYANLFPSNLGSAAKPLRVALGSLIIKERYGYTDRETVEQINENPYLQYFIGLEKYQLEPPFDSSLMVYFRKRLDQDIIKKINEMICQVEKPQEEPRDKYPGAPPGADQSGYHFEVLPEEHKGKLLLDATCSPADIRYPTDLSLLNEAREKTEKTIDTLYNRSHMRRVWLLQRVFATVVKRLRMAQRFVIMASHRICFTVKQIGVGFGKTVLPKSRGNTWGFPT